MRLFTPASCPMIVASALGVVMAGALLSACSGGAGLATLPAQVGTTGSDATHVATPATHGAAAHTVRPPIANCLGGYSINDTVWVETSTSPEQWSLEEYAPFCPNIVIYGPCTGQLFICEQLRTLHVARGPAAPGVHWALVVPVSGPTGPTVPNSSKVLQVTKRAYKLIGDLQIPGSSTAVPIAAAVNPKTYTTYVSVTNPTGGAGVYVYPSGSSSPSEYLTDKDATTAGAGVAIDKKGNIYWAFDDSANNGHIVEFAGGKGQPSELKISPNGVAGDIQIDRREDFVVSEPSEQSIAIYSPKGALLNTFALTGSPSSIDLDAKNANIYIADVTNNLIDQYSYPSGTLIASNPPPAINGVTPVLVAVTAPTR
jgi:hypothetical protein